MSKSYRDQRPANRAARRLEATNVGDAVIPRIVTRTPRKGDAHPVPASVLRYYIKEDVPLEYLYGISRIELRARRNGEVGTPFATYTSDEKSIILYSLPNSWDESWDVIDLDHLRAVAWYGAEIDSCDSRIHISWKRRENLADWFFVEVFCHELGHHFVNQYTGRLQKTCSRKHEEFVANLCARRFLSRMDHKYGGPGKRKFKWRF